MKIIDHGGYPMNFSAVNTALKEASLGNIKPTRVVCYPPLLRWFNSRMNPICAMDLRSFEGMKMEPDENLLNAIWLRHGTDVALDIIMINIENPEGEP